MTMMLTEAQKTALTEAIDFMLNGAQMAHAECGTVSPVIICLNIADRSNNGLIALESGEQAKYFIANAAKLIARFNESPAKADFYCLMSEVWLNIDHAGSQVRPSESPNRQDCVCVSIFDPQGAPRGMALTTILGKGNFDKPKIMFADKDTPMTTSADFNRSGQTLH